MQTYSAIQSRTVITASAAAAYTFSDYSGNTAGHGAAAYGVFKTDAGADTAVAVITDGSALVLSGGPLNAGDAVEVGLAGDAVALTTGVIVGRVAPGNSAAGAGQLIEVVIIHA